MIELKNDRLVFSFPEVHPDARLTITFKRTLRIPDDGTDYPLPPGLGDFPLRHVDDYAPRVPEKWLSRGGVMLPMYQSEALWVRFFSAPVVEHETFYPFAVKIAAGKINAVSGSPWDEGLQAGPQGYVVVPKQPWIDGYCVEKGIIRQFVGMPLGAGYSAEEQLTGQAEYGGIQVQAYPMRREVFEQRFPKVRAKEAYRRDRGPMYLRRAPAKGISLAPGGRMRQEIYDDPYNIQDWDLGNTSRCFVHLVNSVYWRDMTGQAPPTWLPTAADYAEAGLPWFEYYQEDPDIEANTSRRPLPEPEPPSTTGHGDDDKFELPSFITKQPGSNINPGSAILKKLKSVFRLGKDKGQDPLPENADARLKNIVQIKKKNSAQVRDSDSW